MDEGQTVCSWETVYEIDLLLEVCVCVCACGCMSASACECVRQRHRKQDGRKNKCLSKFFDKTSSSLFGEEEDFKKHLQVFQIA